MKHICLLVGLLVCLSCAANPQANVAGLAGDKKLEDDDIVDSDADEVTLNFAHYEVELDDYGKQRTIKFSLISEFLQNCVVPHVYSCDDNGGIYGHILTELTQGVNGDKKTSQSFLEGAQAIGDKKLSADDEESADKEITGAVTLRQLAIICKQRNYKDGGDPFEITAVSVTDSKVEPPQNGKSVASSRLVGSYKKNSKGKIKKISHDDSCFATSTSAKKVIGYEGGGDHGEGKKEDNN